MKAVGRNGMSVTQLNEVMKKCKRTPHIRYVSPVIHAHFGFIVAFKIDTSDNTMEFTVTNNPDPNFDLYVEVNRYLDSLFQESEKE